jgi:hypothetical protein
MAHGRSRPFRPGAFALAIVLLASGPAWAQRELLTKPGQRGQVVIDQISGFRGGVSSVGPQNSLTPSVQYYGPLGFAVERYSQTDAANPQNVDSVTATTFWIAPSADVFVIDHLSIGGMVELAYTTNSGSVPQAGPAGMARSMSVNLPSSTSFAVMPRAGWMFAFGDRWALWPRLSVGYASNAIGGLPNAAGTRNVGGSSIDGLALDLDIGLLFRVNETFFLRLAPEVGWIPAGGNSTTDAAGNSVTASADYLEFSLTGGIGVMFEL